MITEFLASTTSHFDRELKKLASKHVEVPEHFQAVITVLKTNPYNRSRQRPARLDESGQSATIQMN